MNSIDRFCIKQHITVAQFFGEQTIGGSLDLSSLESIPDGFSPTIGGSLDLGGLESIPDGFSPVVGGSLDLSSLESIPDGFSPTIGGSLYLGGLESIPDGFSPTIGGSLDLSSLESIPDGFSPTIGGSLYLSSLESIPEGFNPSVGGSLYLCGGEKHIGSTNIPIIPKPQIKWNVNGVDYICADGIMTEVVSHKANIYRVRRIARKEIEYLITDGNGNYAHGATLREAKEDLLYKVTDRRKSDYAGFKLSDTLTHGDAVKCYRVVTGACSAGTRHFVESALNGNRKEKYTISEVIKLTQGQYGSESFKAFFKHEPCPATETN